MKKRIKFIAGTAALAALTLGTAMTSMAAIKGIGQWCEGLPDGSKPAVTNLENGNAQSNWWFIVSPDGVTGAAENCAANTWLWIDGKCYYFDAEGWMLKAKDGAAGTITDHTGATYHVNADGAWTDEKGVLMTNTDDADEWNSVENLVGSNASAASGNQQKEEKTPTKSNSGADQKVEGVPEGEHVATGKGKVTNTSGEKPDDSDHSNNSYQLGTKSGNTISNSWANYSIDFSGWTSTMPDGNTDTIAIDDANIISIWFDNLGSRSLASFVSSRVDGTADGTAELGGVTYNRYKKSTANPAGTITNYNYVRQIGNAVMVIETTGNPSDISAVLGKMTAAN